MLTITSKISIPDNEIVLNAIRAQGAGGQNVNKVSSAIQLRFDIGASSLAPVDKAKLLALNDHRISKDGVVVIRAQRFRTQERNKQEALDRLRDLLAPAFVVRKKRKKTRPSLGAKKKRLETKAKHGQLKARRGRVGDE